jgi:hypothetical protein
MRGGGDELSGEAKPGQKSVDAAISEFNALRAEIMALSSGQSTLIGVGLTAIGVTAGYGFSDKGNLSVLIIIPFLAAGLILIYAGAGNRMLLIGRYIRTQLWPYIQKMTDPSLPSWEKTLREGRKVSAKSFLRVGVSVPVAILFFALGIAAAFYAPNIGVGIRIFALVALLLSVVSGAALLIPASRR